MRCPTCGARNVERAGWCTQCFASLTVVPDLDAHPDPAVRAPAAVTSPPTDAPRPDVAGAVAVPGDIRQRDGGVEWRCRRCDGWTPLAVASCPTCGSARHGFGERDDPGSRREVAVGTAVAASLLLPGLGHVLLGVVGSGVARILLWALWAGAGIGSLTAAAGGSVASGGGRATGGILLVGAAVLWVASAVDTAALRSGSGRQLLAGRRFAVLVAAVTGGLLVTAMVTAFGALG